MVKDQYSMNRIINGKRYTWYATRKNKKDAQIRAEFLRKKGDMVRIFKGRHKFVSEKEVKDVYRIYIHNPKRLLDEDWFPKKKQSESIIQKRAPHGIRYTLNVITKAKDYTDKEKLEIMEPFSKSEIQHYCKAFNLRGYQNKSKLKLINLALKTI